MVSLQGVNEMKFPEKSVHTKIEIVNTGNRAAQPMTSRQASGEASKHRKGSYPESESVYHLPQAYADLLAPFDWNWYGHFTFRDYPHPETAGKAWDRWMHRLNREIYGVHYWKDKSKGVFWARATEYQKRGSIHFHALIGGIPEYVHRMRYLDDWNISCGICRIYQYEPDKGAEFYMSKSTYAWKRGEIDTNDSLRMELEQTRSCGRAREAEELKQPLIRRPVSSYRW